ncbi:MAG: serine/threonine kinase PknH [Mycobacterium sp.]|jgi:hypothetical protein|nr:serine/threonine kinase PknH [Mycobacterium sp.]
MTVFISYSSRDRDAVKSLTQDLQDADEQVWMDQRLAGGEAWWRAILEQVRGCDVFIFALSQNSIESKPCQAELQYAQALGLPILPVQVGVLDSMALNPLATVQAIDYRRQTSNTGMRLISALHRERARRQPLPVPLPAEPSVPFEYLIRLYTTISNPDYLTPRDQAALVAQLEVGLGEDGQHEAARNDIVTMLTKLRDREDATHRTRSEVEAILASLVAESPTALGRRTDVESPTESGHPRVAADSPTDGPAYTQMPPPPPGSPEWSPPPGPVTAAQPPAATNVRRTRGKLGRVLAVLVVLGLLAVAASSYAKGLKATEPSSAAWMIGICWVLIIAGVTVVVRSHQSRDRKVVISTLFVVIVWVAAYLVPAHNKLFSSTSGDEAGIKAVTQKVVDAYNNADGAAFQSLLCKQAMAAPDPSGFLKAFAGGITSSALQADVLENGTLSISVTAIHVNGERATASLTFSRSKSPSQTQTDTESYLKENGNWTICPTDS